MRRERRTSSSSYGQFYAASTERAGDVLTTSAPRDPGFAGTPGRRLLGANGTTIKADAALRAPGPHHRATTTTTPAAANAAVHVRADTVPRVGAFNGLVGRGSAHRERDPRSIRDAAAGGVPSSTRARVGTHLPGAAGGGSRFGAPSGRYLDDDARRGVVERRETLETLEGPSSAPRLATRRRAAERAESRRAQRDPWDPRPQGGSLAARAPGLGETLPRNRLVAGAEGIIPRESSREDDFIKDAKDLDDPSGKGSDDDPDGSGGMIKSRQNAAASTDALLGDVAGALGERLGERLTMGAGRVQNPPRGERARFLAAGDGGGATPRRGAAPRSPPPFGSSGSSGAPSGSSGALLSGSSGALRVANARGFAPNPLPGDPGASTRAGGVGAASKENQDEHFLIRGEDDGRAGARGPRASRSSPGSSFPFVAGVLDGHGADGKRVSTIVRKALRAALASTLGARLESVATLNAAESDASGAANNSARTFTNPQTTKRLPDRSGPLLPSGSSDGARDRLASAFASAFAEAKRALLTSAAEHRESGCTAVAVARAGDALACANVGDSRAVLGIVYGIPPGAQTPNNPSGGGVGSPGTRRFGTTKPSSSVFVRAVDLSEDHKPDREDERRRIHRAGGAVEPARGPMGFVGPPRVWRRAPRLGGLAVSRAFGDTHLGAVGVISEPEVRTFSLAAAFAAADLGDGLSGGVGRRSGAEGPPKVVRSSFVVLASDGVWDHVTSAEAVRVAAEAGAEGGRWREAAEAVVAKAAEGWRRENNGGYRDDITCVVVPIHDARAG
jgi:serine/threonine protein phosphatase PrpC